MDRYVPSHRGRDMRGCKHVAIGVVSTALGAGSARLRAAARSARRDCTPCGQRHRVGDDTCSRLGAPRNAREIVAWRPMRVIFPGGIELGATGFTSEVGPTPPTWGLYLYERWQPLWPYRYVAWPDFGLPDDEADADRSDPRSVYPRASR